MSVHPVISVDSRPLWDGYLLDEIRLPWCVACNRPHLPPGPCCPFCLGEELDWRTASGRGVISTFCIVRRRYLEDFPPPYVVVQVELFEGPRLTASMPIKAFPDPKVGMPVEARFEQQRNGWKLPVFVPA